MKTTITLLFILIFSIGTFAQSEVAVSKTSANIYAEPDSKSKVVKKVSRSKKLKLNSPAATNGYYSVTFGTVSGWVEAAAVEVKGVPVRIGIATRRVAEPVLKPVQESYSSVYDIRNFKSYYILTNDGNFAATEAAITRILAGEPSIQPIAKMSDAQFFVEYLEATGRSRMTVYYMKGETVITVWAEDRAAIDRETELAKAFLAVLQRNKKLDAPKATNDAARLGTTSPDSLNAETKSGGEKSENVVPIQIPGLPPPPSPGFPSFIPGGDLTSKALSLPNPQYPPAARAVKAKGAVTVKITVDETGNVVETAAISGHPLLRTAAEKAARLATFKPTTLDGRAVRVIGVVVYNFVP